MSGAVRHVAVCGCMPCYLLILKLVCRDTGMQGIDSGPWADVGRGYEPAGGANSSVPYSVMFNFFLGSSSNSDLSRSLGAQGPKKITKKHPARSGLLGGIVRGLEMTTT
jgi:hypothetical protein